MRRPIRSFAPFVPLVLIALPARAVAQRDAAWSNDLVTPPATAAQGGPIAHDPGTAQLVFLRSNGQMLTWDGSALSMVASVGGTALLGASMATSEVPGYTGVIVFGGTMTTGQLFGQTLLFARGGWVRLRLTILPPARTNASMATMGGAPVLFGGIDATGAPLDDLWVFMRIGTTGRWLQAIGTVSPSRRDSAALCPDGSGGLLLFGGRTGTTLHNDTWRLGGGFGWTQLAPTVSPPPGIGPMSFDPVRGEVIHVDPVSRATFRFDPAIDDWQTLPTPGIALSTPFAATTTGGLAYMEFDLDRREHVFVDAGAGLSVFGTADAVIGHRQPNGCTPMLGIGLSFGVPRLGNPYLVDVTGAASSGIWLAIGTASAAAPVPLSANGCLAFVDAWLLLSGQLADTSGRAVFVVTVPADPALVGFEALHQAYAPATGAVTHEFVVRIGR